MRFYIADLHFFHESMNYRMDNRGFASANEMNEYMIAQWNSRVRRGDEVVLLGDFSVGKAKETEEILEKLKGKKYLVIGNHDKYLKDKEFNRNLFINIQPYMEMNDDNRRVILSHYPIFCYNGQYRKNKEIYMLHGHVHETYDQELLDRFVKETQESKRIIRDEEINIPCNMINCFAKWSDYVPLTLDEWIALNKKRLDEKNKNED